MGKHPFDPHERGLCTALMSTRTYFEIDHDVQFSSESKVDWQTLVLSPTPVYGKFVINIGGICFQMFIIVEMDFFGIRK